MEERMERAFDEIPARLYAMLLVFRQDAGSYQALWFYRCLKSQSLKCSVLIFSSLARPF